MIVREWKEEVLGSEEVEEEKVEAYEKAKKKDNVNEYKKQKKI